MIIMKEDEIKNILFANQIAYARHGSIYATLQPSVGAYKNGLGNTMYVMKDHILHMNNEGLAIIAIDDNNGQLLPDTLVFLPINSIQIHLKIYLTHIKMIISSSNGDMVFKVHKNVIGCPWHKENLSFLMLQSTTISR